MNTSTTLKSKIAAMPDSPGVYVMKDALGAIIYIGKALSLRKRVSSYLARELSAKTTRLMSNVTDIEYRLCPSESMALFLEASLIKEYKPKYNVSLRDDKSFPFVKITNEEFPAIYVTRKREDNGAAYFGPYISAGLLKEALKIIRRSFPYRSCKVLPKKACIYYRIKLSPAPCIGKISKAGYAKTIKHISLILEGKSDELSKALAQEMELKAREHKFEEAALLRDKMIALSTLRPSLYNADAALSEVREVLGLSVMPRRIEAFDVSTILGRQATASMVSFYNGLADKDNYRRFRIKTVTQSDDYRMMAEAIFRRYNRLKAEQGPFPDLIVVDGGKGQLSAAKKELDTVGLTIPIISLAKKEEVMYTPAAPKPIKLRRDSAALCLIQHIRDESHRFALKYHRLLRKKRMFS